MSDSPRIKSVRISVINGEGFEERYDFGQPIPPGTPAEYVAPDDTPGTESLAAVVEEIRDVAMQVKSLAIIEAAPAALRLAETNRKADALLALCLDIESLLGV